MRFHFRPGLVSLPVLLLLGAAVGCSASVDESGEHDAPTAESASEAAKGGKPSSSSSSSSSGSGSSDLLVERPYRVCDPAACDVCAPGSVCAAQETDDSCACTPFTPRACDSPISCAFCPGVCTAHPVDNDCTCSLPCDPSSCACDPGEACVKPSLDGVCGCERVL